MSSSCHMEYKTFIKACCTNNIQTGEKVFCRCYFSKFVSCFFADRIKKPVAYFGLYECSAGFQGGKNQINALYMNLFSY